MSQPLALIQLISEETMQNLLPVLALRPARLLHLVTPKVRDRSGPIAVAARHSQIQVDPEPIHLPEMPTIRETFAAARNAIREVKQTGGLPVVNFTGGTKLMSIGAFSAALQEKVPSLYVDTEYGRFLDGTTGDGISQVLGEDLTFQALQSTLRVHSVALANGCPSATKGKDWKKSNRAPGASAASSHGSFSRCICRSRTETSEMTSIGGRQRYRSV